MRQPSCSSSATRPKAHDRVELVQSMADYKVSHPIILTDDIRSNWGNDLQVNNLKPPMLRGG